MPEPDNLYRERAHLVAALAALFPSVLAYNDPDEPEWPVLYLATSVGQMSWHIAPGDLDLFNHVPRVCAADPQAQWDGHTTPEKYERLDATTAAITEAKASGLAAEQPDLSHLCGASTAGLTIDGGIGPCILRVDHDGPLHQAPDGTQWTPGKPPAMQAEDVPNAPVRATALRDQIAERLRADGWEPCTTRAKHGGGHSYRDSCRICAGDIDGITGAVMAVVYRNRPYHDLLAALERAERAEAAVRRVREIADELDVDDYLDGIHSQTMAARIEEALDTPGPAIEDVPTGGLL